MGILDTPWNLNGTINSTDLPGLAAATDTILGGHFFAYFTLLIVGLVCFVYMVGKRYAILTSLSAAFWIVSITAIFLRALNLLDNYIFWICMFMVPASVLLLWWSGRE